MMIRFTQQQLISWGGQEVYEQAKADEKRGAVHRADINGDVVTGVILRDDASEISTGFKVMPGGFIESRCPCPANRNLGMICRHVVALGIALMKRHADPERERRYREELRHAKHMEEVSRSGQYVKRSPKGLAVKICLSLTANWRDEFQNANTIPVGLFFLPENGTAPLSPSQLPAAQGIKLSDENEELLSLLEDICEGAPPAQIKLSQSDFITILICAKGARIVAGGKEEWRTVREPVPSALMVDIDESTGELSLHPKAEIPGGEEGEQPKFLVCGRSGVVTHAGKIMRLRNILPPPYHSIYQQDEIIPRERVIPFIRRDLPTLRRVFPTIMQIRESLFECVPIVPRFILDLKGTAASIQAVLYAEYGSNKIPVGAKESSPEEVALPDPDNIMRYRTRHREAERAARLKLLNKRGFHSDQDGRLFITEPRRVLTFLGKDMPALGREGWKFTFSPSLEKLMDSTPVITPVVNIDAVDERSFEVGFTFDASGEGSLNASDVQVAVNRGDGFLKLNGRTYFFDSEAVENMRSIFNDCRCRQSERPGYFRMPQIYAPFVHASLTEMDGIDLEITPSWQDRARLVNRDKNLKIKEVPLGERLEGILRPYQKDGVYWMRFLECSGMNGLLADEMGLGKTLQTLTWLSLERVRDEARGKPALVICPTSLVQNWNHEAEKFVPHMKRLVINGPKRDKLFAMIGNSDLVITSYALIRRDLEYYDGCRFSAIVLDEAQHIKNRTTQNAKAVKQLHADSKLVLTGTPIENSVSDIWSIMDFLMPDYLGNHDEFRINYEDPLSDPALGGDAAVHDKLRRKLHPFLLRRIKKDVAKDLPDKIVQIQYCGMSPDQKRYYDQLLGECRSKIKDLVGAKGFDASRFEILALLTQMRQTCCHLNLIKDRKKIPGEAPSEKLEAFFEIVGNAMAGGHRILVFSQFVSMLSIIRGELEERGVKYCYLDGQTSNRLEQCQMFNLDSSIPIFLISLKAGGTGLNLTGADVVIHFDPWWNPAVEDQATDRAHRIGQKRTVYSIKMITADSIEERVLEMQRRKQELIDATVNASDGAVLSKLTYDDIKRLIDL